MPASDRALIARLAAGRPIVELAHPRQRTTGVIAVHWHDERAIRICAHGCQLTALPELALPELVRLDVGGNQLAALPALPAELRELYVDDNKLTALPPLPALAVLDANRNWLTTLPPLVGLEFAYLADNQLTALPELRDVRYLNVGDNPLHRLTLDDVDAGVRELRAERAELASLVLELPALRELALRGNQLAALSETIGRARQLRSLDLRGNALDTLPDALRELPLDKLDLRWNPLRAAPTWLDELRERGCLVYT